VFEIELASEKRLTAKDWIRMFLKEQLLLMITDPLPNYPKRRQMKLSQDGRITVDAREKD
jgi:hypothetical protein